MDTNEKNVRLFSRAVLHSVQVLDAIEDAHLYRTLQDAIEYGIRTAMGGDLSSSKFLDACGDLRQCLEEVGSLQPDVLRAQLLAERHVLLLLIHVGAHIRTPVAKKPVVQGSPKAVTREESTPAKVRPSVDEHVSESAQQVLTGVQQTGPVRAKDIIAHCSPMSERTVRRSLRELVEIGRVTKDASHGTVRYRVAQEQES